MTKKEMQIQRIRRMETILDELQAAEQGLSTALEQFDKLPAKVKKLNDYYASYWLDDFEAEEAGLLPKDLKRGVLTEDAVWDALTDYRTLTLHMLDSVKNSFTKGPF